jgi:hypothetical protein
MTNGGKSNGRDIEPTTANEFVAALLELAWQSAPRDS